MKKLHSPPTGPMPDAYRSNTPATDSMESFKIDVSEPAEPATAPSSKVPVGSIYGHNLKRIKSYKKVRRNKKLSIQGLVFVQDLKIILSEFPLGEHQLDDELLVEVLSIAESYFVYGSKSEREAAKTEAVMLLMKPYFLDDEKLLKKTVCHTWHRVVKSNAVKRVWSKVKFFFLKLM